MNRNYNFSYNSGCTYHVQVDNCAYDINLRGIDAVTAQRVDATLSVDRSLDEERTRHSPDGTIPGVLPSN